MKRKFVSLWMSATVVLVMAVGATPALALLWAILGAVVLVPWMIVDLYLLTRGGMSVRKFSIWSAFAIVAGYLINKEFGFFIFSVCGAVLICFYAYKILPELFTTDRPEPLAAPVCPVKRNTTEDKYAEVLVKHEFKKKAIESLTLTPDEKRDALTAEETRFLRDVENI